MSTETDTIEHDAEVEIEEIDNEQHEELDDTDDEPTDDEVEGADDLGDAGKKALDAMKAKWRAERDRRKAAEAKLEGDKDAPDAAEILAKATQRILRSVIKAAAAGKLADPADAYKFLNLDEFEVDDDGNVDEDEIADAIDELIQNKPYLAAQGGRRFKGSADGGTRKGSGPSQLTQSDLDRMTAEEVVKARQEGRLDRLMGIR